MRGAMDLVEKGLVPDALTRAAGAPDAGALRWRTAKEFHVSPFMDMKQEYGWSLRRREIGGGALASALARWPFMTLKVVGGIHWEALKLWAKDVPVYTHPRYRGAEGR